MRLFIHILLTVYNLIWASTYVTNLQQIHLTSSTLKLSRSLSDVQEEESDRDDILNVLLKGSKLTNFSQMRIFWLMFLRQSA